MFTRVDVLTKFPGDLVLIRSDDLGSFGFADDLNRKVFGSRMILQLRPVTSSESERVTPANESFMKGMSSRLLRD
jgi:hypothetical protein